MYDIVCTSRVIVRSINATSVVSLLVARDSSTSGRTPAYLWWAASRRLTYSWRCRANRDSARVNRWVQHCHLVSSSREQPWRRPRQLSSIWFYHCFLAKQSMEVPSFYHFTNHRPYPWSTSVSISNITSVPVPLSLLLPHHWNSPGLPSQLSTSASTHSPTIPSSVHPWHSKPSSPVPQ